MFHDANRMTQMFKHTIDGMFERLRARLLYPAPGQYINSLVGMYDSATRQAGYRPDLKHVDALKSITDSYLEMCKHRAINKVLHATHTAVASGNLENLSSEVADIMRSTNHEVERIVKTEVNKYKALACYDNIKRNGALVGDNDPQVFFDIVSPDPCKDCVRMHLNKDGTPKVYKTSELLHGYYDGGKVPSIMGCHPHCFVGSTRINTNHGLLTIKELFDIGTDLSVTVDNRVRNRRVNNNQFGDAIPGEVWFDPRKSGVSIFGASNVYDTGIKKCIKFVLNSGHELEVSEEHDMWVVNNGIGSKIKAKDVKLYSQVPIISGEGQFGNLSFPNEAELLGSIIGDGSINKDKAIFNFFGQELEYGQRLCDIASEIAGSKINFLTKEPNNKYNVKSARFTSHKIGKILKNQFGLDKKPKKVPLKIWQANKETVSAFLRGLYSADGHSERNPSIVLSQNDLDFLKEIQLLLSLFGLKSRIFNHGLEKQCFIKYANGDKFLTKRKQAWRLIIAGHYQVKKFLSNIGFGPINKQNKASNYLSESIFVESDRSYRTAYIIDIIETGEKQTYCLTEPMTNTVTANGIVTGQCRCILRHYKEVK